MFLWLMNFLDRYPHNFYVFNDLIFRSIASTLTALILVLFLSPRLIHYLIYLQIEQIVRNDGPQTHLKKTSTPTMGGVLIIVAVVVSMLSWGDLSNRFLWITSLIVVAFGSIGWIDDYRKIIRKNSRGLSVCSKYLLQSSIGVLTAVYLYCSDTTGSETALIIPVLKHTLPNLGFFYIVLAYFVIVGSSNAVNLTDGLDGLALMPMIMISGALGVFAYISGNYFFAHRLLIPYIAGSGEVMVFCGALVGAGLGFLWYNTYPAQMFMGDVGSLGLGAGLGITAVVVRQELVYFLMSGIFVIETLSVILQVSYFKLSGGKRIFRMAPLHHHFELKGWSEPKVIVRFWIITFILVLCGLATLTLK